MTGKKPHIISFMILLSIVFLCFLCGTSPACAQKVEKNDYFYVLNSKQGLSDNHVLQMMQLADNRLAVRTRKGVNLYDGKHFLFVPLPSEKAQKLARYSGQTHLYADAQNRLWVKDYREVFCIDLKKGRILEHPFDNVQEHPLDNVQEPHLDALPLRDGIIVDLFVDCKGDVWTVKELPKHQGQEEKEHPAHHEQKGEDGFAVVNTSDGTTIPLQSSWGSLQDLDTDGKHVYAFFDSGRVVAFRNGKLAYMVSAYSPSEARCYRGTSLTTQTPSGQFYQIRTGYDERKKHDVSVFLHFDPETRKYAKIFACDYILHTLNMSSDNQALISSQRGYLMFDFKVGNAPREVRELALPDGKSLTTGINTVYRDREGAIWLGTYNDGLIYVSPMLGLFFTIDKPWWQSGWVNALILVVAVLLMAGIFFLLRNRRTKKVVKNNDVIQLEDMNRQEPEFITKVRSLIEQHLSDTNYGVEQLAHDLCMERTGLYKKLTSLTETTPVAFIRNIRLQRAASWLREGELTVNEIAEKAGFSSPSYFTKCFKKEFGMLPSEYK